MKFTKNVEASKGSLNLSGDQAGLQSYRSSDRLYVEGHSEVTYLWVMLLLVSIVSL